MAINLDEALAVVAKHRGQRVVIPTMASVPVWFGLSNQPLDFTYMPSAMGHGPELGLGLALAQPDHGVIVLNGDGSMLMNLGSLVTLAQNPAPGLLDYHQQWDVRDHWRPVGRRRRADRLRRHG